MYFKHIKSGEKGKIIVICLYLILIHITKSIDFCFLSCDGRNIFLRPSITHDVRHGVVFLWVVYNERAKTSNVASNETDV